MSEVSSSGPRAAEALAPGAAALPRRAPVIGLMGGVASGKSLVARQFADLGATVLDGDRAGHAVLRLDEVKAALRERWGSNVFDDAGEVNRAAVAQRVFQPTDEARRELEFLEGVTHPRIGEMLVSQLQQARDDRDVPAIVLDAPVMLEAGWSEICDKMVYVDARSELRLARARQRGWSEADFARREAAQVSLDTKRAKADVAIDNSGTPEETRAQVERFWRGLGLSL
ncbi:MAG: dephospho-CoA kinase [Pirellulales bacterium]|nr:dephospho-CoA kinase [Pirellulales bacterium]